MTSRLAADVHRVNEAIVRAGAPVDENISGGSQSYTATRMYRVNGDVLRVTVHVDSYQMQSYSKVEVLSADRKWTVLATGPRLDKASADVPSPYAPAEAKTDAKIWNSHVGYEAETLIARAVMILG